MTDQNNQEPTMEEILASIRRIISEDDPPAASAEEAAPAAEPVAAAAPPAPAPVADEMDEEEEVLELTELVSLEEPAAPMQSMGDLDVFPSAAPAPAATASSYEPPAPTAFTPSPQSDGDSLVSSPAASVAASSFAALTGAIGMPREGRQLEDVVRELLRPLMKQWLDENLPRIVESAVQAEVERIARLHR